MRPQVYHMHPPVTLDLGIGKGDFGVFGIQDGVFLVGKDLKKVSTQKFFDYIVVVFTYTPANTSFGDPQSSA